jgi:type II secretory pathway pseudopilin PulG
MNNNKGYTLIELVAAIPIVVLVFILISISLIKFARSYQENKILRKAQNEAFNVIEYFRYGYAKKEIIGDKNLIGILTATKLSIGGNGNSLMIYPISSVTNSNYYSHFYQNHSEIWVNSQYGNNAISRRKIFPSEDIMYGREPELKVTELRFYNAFPSGNGEVRLLGIDLKIRVRFREKARNQSSDDDLKENTRTIEFHTKVYAENSDIQLSNSDTKNGSR